MAKKKADIVAIAGGGGGKPPPEPEPLYSKNPEFLGEAFSLYCRGMSLRAVTDAMRPEWPEVSERTVQRIAKDNGWEKSRASYLKLHAEAAASAEGLVPEVVLHLQRLRAKLEGRGALSATEIFAYRALVEDLLIYTGRHPKLSDKSTLAVSSDKDIAALLEAIQEDDVVGPAWRKRKAKIQKAYKGKIAKSGGKK